MNGPAYEKVYDQGIADVGRTTQQTSCEVTVITPTTCKLN